MDQPLPAASSSITDSATYSSRGAAGGRPLPAGGWRVPAALGVGRALLCWPGRSCQRRQAAWTSCRCSATTGSVATQRRSRGLRGKELPARPLTWRGGLRVGGRCVGARGRHPAEDTRGPAAGGVVAGVRVERALAAVAGRPCAAAAHVQRCLEVLRAGGRGVAGFALRTACVHLGWWGWHAGRRGWRCRPGGARGAAVRVGRGAPGERSLQRAAGRQGGGAAGVHWSTRAAAPPEARAPRLPPTVSSAPSLGLLFPRMLCTSASSTSTRAATWRCGAAAARCTAARPGAAPGTRPLPPGPPARPRQRQHHTMRPSPPQHRGLERRLRPAAEH
jgi:hypothetical protein